MTEAILEVRPFPQPQMAAECMILPLQTLFSRSAAYPMDMPQRLHSYMVTLFTRGAGQHLVDFQVYDYREKMLLFVAQHQVHQWQINLKNEGLVLAFSNEFLYQSAADRNLLARYRIFDYSLQSPMLLLNDTDYQHFLLLFQELRQEFDQPGADSFKAEIMRNLVRTLLLRAERLKQSETLPTALSHYQDFARFKDRLENDYPRTRNVIDYARALGYSPKKLNQLSQTVLNKPAKVFIDERVILEIKRLLVHTDLSIKEIAEQTGFDEPTNLIKFFKRHTRQTPTTFREGLSKFHLTTAQYNPAQP